MGVAEVAAILLAGGESRRMGEDKALVDFGGEPMARWMAERLRRVCSPVLVVAPRPKHIRLAPLGLELVADVFEGKGPLAGLHAGLAAAGDGFHFVVSCDQPFVQPEAVRHLLEQASALQAEAVDAVVPRVGGRLQVLHAVYHGRAAAVAESVLLGGALRVQDLLARLRWVEVPQQELEAFGDPAQMVFNVNTPDELAVARTLLAGGHLSP